MKIFNFIMVALAIVASMICNKPDPQTPDSTEIKRDTISRAEMDSIIEAYYQMSLLEIDSI